ncbi:MAG: LysR substrate-binding domain-containing protein [Methyloligellaceae bacterium]
MQFTQMRSFQAVALEGSFTGAAKRLDRSQPTVTRQVAELEELFGIELFHRRGRQVALSEVGKSLLAITERIFTTSEEAVELLQAASGLATGLLRVSAVGPVDIVHVVSAFSGAYPGINISLTICNSSDALNSLIDFRADVALLTSAEVDPRLHFVDFAARPIVLYVNAQHPWSNRDTIRFAELDDQPILIRERGSQTRFLFETECARAGVEPTVKMEINSRDALREAVAHGLGIGVIGDRALPPDARLHQIRISDHSIRIQRRLACLKERQNARMIRSFLDIGRDVIGQNQ